MMQLGPKISVIVPVYNSEKYVADAIQSILDQGFKDFELLLVNDGSTDGSKQVCEQYVRSDNRVILLNKPNGGLCSARNMGIDHAKGEYIMFMDNDDAFTPDALFTVWNTIQKYDPDIVRFNRKRIQIYADGKQKTDIFGCKGICDNGKPVFFDREKFFQNYITVRSSGCFAGIWNGAYRRSLFKDVRFDTSITAGGEDTLVNIELYRRFRSVVFIPDVLYTYYRRISHSISTTFQKNQIQANIKEAALERALITEAKVPVSSYYPSMVLYIAFIIKVMMHKDSSFRYTDKCKMLKHLHGMKCFKLEWEQVRRSSAFWLVKAFLYLFIKERYAPLLFFSEIIFKLRRNI